MCVCVLMIVLSQAYSELTVCEQSNIHTYIHTYMHTYVRQCIQVIR